MKARRSWELSFFSGLGSKGVEFGGLRIVGRDESIEGDLDESLGSDLEE